MTPMALTKTIPIASRKAMVIQKMENEIRSNDATKAVYERSNELIRRNDQERIHKRSLSDNTNNEQESSSDERGKDSGSGSGGGYNADADYYSDSSSSNNDSSNNGVVIASSPALPSHPPQKRTIGCAVSNVIIQGDKNDTHICIEKQSTATGRRISDAINSGEGNACQNDDNDNDNNRVPEHKFFDDTNNAINRPRYRGTDNSIASSSSSKTSLLPQWNSVKIQHPMDPRIDLSIVGVMNDTSQLYTLQNNNNITSINASAGINTEINQNLPPNNDVNAASSLSFSGVEVYTNLLESVRPFFSHEIACKQGSGPRPSASTGFILEPLRPGRNDGNLDVNAETAVAANETISSTNQRINRDDDDFSMIDLARLKRKHTSRNGSSLSESSDKEELAKQQHNPQFQQQVSSRIEDNVSSASKQAEVQQQRQIQDTNDQKGKPQIGILTMVSEYSSSARNGGSGASNNNISSGSGGNTGSGSNQGGSSGSGNDQGGISSNGNGSAGSSNEVGKGSSEELMDNNEKYNNSHGNHNQNNNAVSIDIKATSMPENHHHQFISSQYRLSNKSRDDDNTNNESGNKNKNAVREQKLQDKKRKRMNMRREYEDKIEQEMESSESSDGEEGILHPGKPITLDKAVSFTKTAKLVIKPSLPFTVIYTNAAYSRLCGIDSHNAVGKPISTLLSLPRAQLSLIDFKEDHKTFNSKEVNEQELDGDSEKHTAADTAGRARAAVSKNDNIKTDFEKVVVASCNSKLDKVSTRCSLHQVLGHNVKVIKPKRNGEERSGEESSLSSSSDSPHNMIECTMSISPVLSSTDAYIDYHQRAKRNENDQDSQQQKSKRRKHHQMISHYMIQLELFDGSLTEDVPEKESPSNMPTRGSLKQHDGIETKILSRNQDHIEHEVESVEPSSNFKHLSATA